MTISSRTPEGEPQRCPICGRLSHVEYSDPGGDACCPNCGSLLTWFRDRVSHRSGIASQRITFTSSFVDDLGLESLDDVELIMQIEVEFGLKMPDAAAEQIKTVADAVRWIEEHCGH